MKAILYPFGPSDSSTRLPHDFPDWDWTVAASAGIDNGIAMGIPAGEPMAVANPLWDMPNVIVTPHVAGQGSSGYREQRKLFGENLERFRDDRPMLNECKVPART